MKQLLACALLYLMSISSQALELKICDLNKPSSVCDRDISNMDDTLGFLYQYVHKFSEHKDFVSKNSEDFKLAVNACDGKECVADLFASQIGYMFDNLDESITVGTVSDIKGIWYANDAASFTNYGSIIMTDQFLYWGVNDAYGNALLSSNNKDICRSKYTLVKDEIGTVFVDHLGRESVVKEDADFDTYVARLDSSTCDDADFMIGAIRLTVHYRNMRSLSVIEYNKNGQPAKRMSFIR